MTVNLKLHLNRCSTGQLAGPVNVAACHLPKPVCSNNQLVNLPVDVTLRPSRYLAGLTAITVTKTPMQGTTDRMGMYYSLG